MDTLSTNSVKQEDGQWRCKRCGKKFKTRQETGHHAAGNHPLSEEEKVGIRREYNNGLTTPEIAILFDRSASAVRTIIEEVKVQSVKKNIPMISLPNSPVIQPINPTMSLVDAFESRVLEFHDLLKKKDTRIQELEDIVKRLQSENVQLAQSLNNLQLSGKMFNEQLQIIGKTLQ